MPRFLEPSSGNTLLISFNRQEWFSVATSLTHEAFPRVVSLSSAFGFADAENFTTSIEVTGTDFDDATHIVFADYSYKLADSISSTLASGDIPNFYNISYLDSYTPFNKYKTPVEIGKEGYGDSEDEVAYTHISHFKIYSQKPVLLDSAGDTLYLNGTGLIYSPYTKCKFGSLTPVAAVHVNSTMISCAVPAIADISLDFLVSITLNGIEYETVTIDGEDLYLIFIADLIVYSIDPVLGFEDEIDIVVKVQAETIYDISSLTCLVHQVEILGTYYLDPADGLTYVLCTIPSYSYLQETAITSIDSSNTVVIEVSNNGENFSASGKTFKFLAIDQLLGAYPVFGPDSGGTTVSVEMVDLPESSLFDVSCEFPGYSPISISHISDTEIQCVTPELIEEVANITSYEGIAIATVNILFSNEYASSFNFYYVKQMLVDGFTPPNRYYSPSETADLEVFVNGFHFIPVDDQLLCKISYLSQSGSPSEEV